MSLSPSGLCVVAATGHTDSHGAFSHCMHGTGMLATCGSSADTITLPGGAAQDRAGRLQNSSRLVASCVLPIIGMLFSATHAITHALQPVQALRSMTMPHWYCDLPAFGSSALSPSP